MVDTGNPLRVWALVPGPPDLHPGQRFRIEQWAPPLRQEGIHVEYVPFLNAPEVRLLQQPGPLVSKVRVLLTAMWRRLSETPRAGSCDLVYVFRESALVGPAIVERLLARRRVPFVFDFDDAVWVRYVSPSNSYFSLLRFPGKTGTSCRMARAVIAGNSFLESYTRRYNDRVTVVPTTIDTDLYRPRSLLGHGVPIIGWTGSHSTARYLEIIRPALERLRQRLAYKMVVVGAEGFAPRGVEVEHRPWRSASEVKDLSDFDVGVMPLADTEWERGKCALKALQYMALGIPPVLSPVGANREVVEDGVSGRFAASSEEWERALYHLLTEPELRARLGVAARTRVETSYSTRVHAPRVADVLRRAGR